MADNEKELVPNSNDFTGASATNILNYVMRSIIQQTVHTSIPVVVTGVERSGTGSGAGYVSCKALVMRQSAKGDSIPNTDIPRLPYFRYQHGKCAVIADPEVGDIGLAVFAQQDCSNVDGTAEEKSAGSFRTFDMSDGFYIGGFFGKTPETFIYLEDDEIKVENPKKISLNAPIIELNATASIDMTAPQINLNGQITGGGSGGASATFNGDLTVKKEVTGNGVKLSTHTHTGVQTGNGSTGEPEK